LSFEQFLRDFQAILRRGASATEEAKKDKAARAKKASKEALDYVFGVKRANWINSAVTNKRLCGFLLSAITSGSLRKSS
jgi:hypothetical protein